MSAVDRKRLPKEYRKLLRACEDDGAEAIQKKDGIMAKWPDGRTTMFHTSPSQRWLHKLKRKELRQMGVEV